MRQITPQANLVLAVLAGLGLLATLTLPWYSAPVEDTTPTDGPVERAAFQLAHTFKTGADGMIDGQDALGDGRLVLVVLVVAIAVIGLAISANGMRRSAEDVMRVVALLTPVIVGFVAITHPGTEAPVRIHYGMLIAFLATFVMSSAAWHGASMREKPAPTKPQTYSMR
jgi:hypothetical protein